jgi:peptidoglycan/xylan/chitin deacetylase (PgdA/CDA1 family)
LPEDLNTFAKRPSLLRRVLESGALQSMLGDLSYAIRPERLGPKVSDRVIWRVATGEKKIALTFDDGPHPVFTPQVLDVLERHRVSATFFLIGRNIEQNFGLAQRITQSGHEVGNHTFTHPLMFKLASYEMRSEISRTDGLLRALGNKRPRFLRPPSGLFSKRVLDIVGECGYQAVIGDVYPRDPHLPGTDKLVDRVLGRVVAGSIVILHDGGNSNPIDRSQTISAVAQLIPQLQDRGFEFVRLSELIGT